jgi:putative molybdopterin biosynthesis protein
MMAQGGTATPPKRVCRLRNAIGISQMELASRCGISRQALGAIEAGIYQPSVTVAIKLARELGETAESLFGESAVHESAVINVPWAGGTSNASDNASGRVVLARLARKLVALPEPRPGYWLAPTMGRLQRSNGKHATIQSFRSPEEIDATLLVAGCDPSVTILIDWLTRKGSQIGVVALPYSSRKSLATLANGAAHAAGVHLRDANASEYNLEPVRRAIGRRRMVVFNFAGWEVGLVTAKGRTRINELAEVTRADVRIINREAGSGARQALDEALAEAGISFEQLNGYEDEVGGHLEVAASVAAGQAATGVTIRVAAEVFGLGFIPLREERYDLVIPENELESIPVRRMMDLLNSRRFAQEIGQLCAYDTSRMGEEVARINC